MIRICKPLRYFAQTCSGFSPYDLWMLTKRFSGGHVTLFSFYFFVESVADVGVFIDNHSSANCDRMIIFCHLSMSRLPSNIHRVFLFGLSGLSYFQCGSSRSVAPIKAGFVARVGRRKAGS